MLERLTATQVFIYLLVCEGLSNQEIAERRFIDVKSVKAHVTKILARTGHKSRAKLMAAHYNGELEKLREQLARLKYQLPEGRA